MLHKRLVGNYAGDSASTSPSLLRVSIRHFTEASLCSAPGAGLSPASCPNTHALHTEIRKCRPALCLLLERQSNLSPIHSKKRDWWVKLTAHLPLGVSACPTRGPRCVVGVHLSKSSDLLIARAHQRLIWTEKWQLRRSTWKNLKISFKERPACK